MTQLMFLENSYLREMDAKILKVNGDKVILDKTIFYFNSGGQPADTGKIIKEDKEHMVIDVRKENGEIWYKLDRPGLKVNDNVHCILDWSRRYKLMRSHTAMHLLCSLLERDENAMITGNQIQEDKSRVDFDLEKCDKDKIINYVARANKLIEKGARIKHYYMEREEAMKMPELFKLKNVLPKNLDVLRIVEIDGIDRQADGGTHVADIKEIGKIELISIENKGKENRRVYFKVV